HDVLFWRSSAGEEDLLGVNAVELSGCDESVGAERLINLPKVVRREVSHRRRLVLVEHGSQCGKNRIILSCNQDPQRIGFGHSYNASLRQLYRSLSLQAQHPG